MSGPSHDGVRCLVFILIFSSAPGYGQQRQPPQRELPELRTDESPRPQAPSGTSGTGSPRGRSSVGTGFGFSFGFGGGQKDPEKFLVKKGPYIPAVFSMSALTVRGFVRGGWPMVLDYEIVEPGALVLLTVSAAGVEPPFYYRLASSAPGRPPEPLILKLPDRFGARLRIAWYSVRSLTNEPGEMEPVRFHVFGLGAGPAAVGSVGIDELKFGPPNIRPQEDQRASYSFHARSDFNKIAAEFLKVSLSENQVVANLVDQDEIRDVKREDRVTARTWDGKAGKVAVNKRWRGKPSLGTHLLQVRGWRGSKKARDWVIAWSSDIVSVE